MSTDTDLVTGFFDRLETLDSPAGDLPILWPGLTTQPPDTGMWLEPRAFPGDTVNPFYGEASKNRYGGFWQVGVGFRPGAGEVAPRTIAAQIASHFDKGTVIAGASVWQRPSIGSTVTDGHRQVVPVTIRYRGMIGV